MEKENTTKEEIKDNRIILSVLFGFSGFIFFLLFADSHMKKINQIKNEVKMDAELGQSFRTHFGKVLKNKSFKFK